jgi:hypothetical protein
MNAWPAVAKIFGCSNRKKRRPGAHAGTFLFFISFSSGVKTGYLIDKEQDYPRNNFTHSGISYSQYLWHRKPTKNMPQHETKHCPRCMAPFECKAGNIAECQCSSITFSEEEKTYISNTYSDCLCRKCLLDMKHEMRLKSFNQQSEDILKPIQKKN